MPKERKCLHSSWLPAGADAEPRAMLPVSANTDAKPKAVDRSCMSDRTAHKRAASTTFSTSLRNNILYNGKRGRGRDAFENLDAYDRVITPSLFGGASSEVTRWLQL